MKPVRILFVIENAHYPQDTRVYNECTSLSKLFDCYVLAPKAKGQSVVERVEAATCYRYPAFDGTSIKWIPLEYLISLFWIALLVPIVALAKGIRVVHVANPPDMIIPMIAWLKLLGTRIVFDAHDISTETLKGKMSTERSSLSLFLPLLEQFESLSIRVADLAIATNESILTRIRQKSADKRTWIVRNGNATVYASVDKVNKPPANGAIRLGYFGVLANDRAAGLDNIITVARVLANRGVPFSFSIVGNGHGLPRLKQMVDAADMTDRFEFHGFVPIPQAYQIIKSFDFGFVSWGDTPKNNLHTAMKVMDYMCCAVPVCCLELREQIRSTNGIGIHGSTFEEVAAKLIRMHEDPTRYEDLRRQTLERFNTALCWELQERNLLEAYKSLSLPA